MNNTNRTQYFNIISNNSYTKIIICPAVKQNKNTSSINSSARQVIKIIYSIEILKK